LEIFLADFRKLSESDDVVPFDGRVNLAGTTFDLAD